MPRALVLGGTGAVGRAVALALLQDGWEVDLTGRNVQRFDPDVALMGARYTQSDRREMDEAVRVVGDGVDLLVDCVCYTATDASQLVAVARNAGSTVMISSKALYVDPSGRHSNSPGGARFDGPIRETSPIMSPYDSDFNSAEGYGANKAAAELVLLESGLPISILRPSKIHGVGARRPREWFFVKRILDRRPLILAKGGRGIESTTASTNLAALILFLATRPGQRILNAADPDVLAVKSMAAIIAGHLNYEWSDVYLLEEAPDGLGRSPWDGPAPVVLDMTSALELGYEPAGDYDSTVRDEINWLADIAIESNAFHLPADFDSEFFDGFFDYEAEDAFLRSEIRQMRQK